MKNGCGCRMLAVEAPRAVNRTYVNSRNHPADSAGRLFPMWSNARHAQDRSLHIQLADEPAKCGRICKTIRHRAAHLIMQQRRR